MKVMKSVSKRRNSYDNYEFEKIYEYIRIQAKCNKSEGQPAVYESGATNKAGKT